MNNINNNYLSIGILIIIIIMINVDHEIHEQLDELDELDEIAIMNNNNEDQLQQLNSLKILVDGIKLAQKRGAFTLEESANLWEAIKHFIDK
jgi:hypothetical protein